MPMPDCTRWRMISAPGEPPGSRVTMARSFAASSRFASLLICVDFPEPSPPSNEMNLPRPEGRLTVASAMSELLCARAEHADDEFAGAIDGAAHGRTGSYRFGGIDRRLHGDIGTAPHPHDAD